MTALRDFLLRHPRLFVLTGAGISTDSGIPGYRDEQGAWQRTPPVLLQDFLGSHAARQRYWARSMVGWPIAAGAQPNAAHHALATLQAQGRVAGLVTQNVDGLHQRAGSAGVIELHGTIASASCLACGERHERAGIQRELETHNPDWLGLQAEAAADGDAHLESEHFGRFRVPACRRCAGVLKPDVVFFGDSVPRERVQAATQALEAADAVLVVGSSLMVYSGYRFCVWAERMGKPVAALNLGRTRADAMLSLKVAEPCGPALTALVAALAATA
ncbi:NAD-dependent protein deacetylase [Cupriavidus malaysiensis]|uniref:NAD-dependent protein deacetylase n=1 Tax=Cupriavidus malaysiensis TaxID=367825 RepID=A0ABN4TUL8_9BURK|nr:NAD-dependent protein deacetylase [Cupriavidus malaysiensis]AOZ08376.1 NAD-dependent deacetylase [Cupriavidus malaysiensis]